MAKILCWRFEVTRELLGWLGATLSLIGLIMLYFCLENPDVVTKWLISLADDQSKIDYKKMRNNVVWSCVLYVFLSFMNLITSLCLILGIHRYCIPSFKYPFVHLIKEEEQIEKRKSSEDLLPGSDRPTQTFNV